jgi:Carbamoyl-phosphate synthase L chain, ATP binding domain
MPRSLARAGFNVVLLAPRGSLAEKSRYVSRIQRLDDPVSADGWLGAFAEIVASAAPRLLMPCDDTALQLLLELVTLQDFGVELPSHLRAAMDAALGALIRESLGDPAHYRDSIDETLLPLLAQSIGVDVAPFVVTRSPDEVREFAQRHGFPVVVKRRFSSAGSGVAVCTSAEELRVAIDRFARMARCWRRRSCKAVRSSIRRWRGGDRCSPAMAVKSCRARSGLPARQRSIAISAPPRCALRACGWPRRWA